VVDDRRAVGVDAARARRVVVPAPVQQVGGPAVRDVGLRVEQRVEAAAALPQDRVLGELNSDWGLISPQNLKFDWFLKPQFFLCLIPNIFKINCWAYQFRWYLV
jgi:hypothetical protein